MTHMPRPHPLTLQLNSGEPAAKRPKKPHPNRRSWTHPSNSLCQMPWEDQQGEMYSIHM